MIASGQLARVIETIHTAGAKAVLVGDAMQLQPIQAGAAFRAISERVGYVELEGLRRQRTHDWRVKRRWTSHAGARLRRCRRTQPGAPFASMTQLRPLTNRLSRIGLTRADRVRF